MTDSNVYENKDSFKSEIKKLYKEVVSREQKELESLLTQKLANFKCNLQVHIENSLTNKSKFLFYIQNDYQNEIVAFLMKNLQVMELVGTIVKKHLMSCSCGHKEPCSTFIEVDPINWMS